MKKRYVVLLGIVGVCVMASLGGPSADELSKVQVQSTLSRGGFGAVTIGSFTIENNNSFAIKDPVVRCSHLGSSGSEVDSNSRKIYKEVNAGGSAYAGDINMGFTATQQITRSVCKVSSFTKVAS